VEEAPQPITTTFTGAEWYIPQPDLSDQLGALGGSWVEQAHVARSSGVSHEPVWGPWDSSDGGVTSVCFCTVEGCDVAAWQVRDVPRAGHEEGDVELAPVGIPMQVDEVMTAEVVVRGHAVDLTQPPPSCQHRVFHQKVESANMVEPDGTLVARRAQLSMRCAECGIPVRFRVKTLLDTELNESVVPDGLLSNDRLTVAIYFDLLTEDPVVGANSWLPIHTDLAAPAASFEIPVGSANGSG